jgi:hypothetical protein
MVGGCTLGFGRPTPDGATGDPGSAEPADHKQPAADDQYSQNHTYPKAGFEYSSDRSTAARRNEHYSQRTNQSTATYRYRIHG